MLAANRRLPLALLTGGSLLLELALIRTLSVALWYPVAYVCLSTAMLGFGGAAIAVALSEKLRALPEPTVLAWGGVGFTASAALGYPVWNLLPVDPMSLGVEPLQIVWVPILFILVTLPFGFAGLFVSSLFARSPADSARLYAADLAGAAVGVLVYVVVIGQFGGPGCIILASTAGLVATLLAVDLAPTPRMVTVLAATALVALTPTIERVVPLKVTHNKLLGNDRARELPRGSAWTVSSAIDVIPWQGGSSIIIDGGTAMTAAPPGDRRKPIPKPTGLRAIPFALGANDSALVIGSGGGVEVRAALGAGVPRILALEIDPVINELVTGMLARQIGNLFDYPSVELVTAEARAHLAAHDEKFDTIMAFHTISNAASSTGAMSLAESYLLTEEAMALLLDRLTDDGVLLMSRPEAQIARLVATLSDVWDRPTPLKDHIAVVTETPNLPDFITAVVVSMKPLSARDEVILREVTTGRIAYLPSGDGDLRELILAAADYASDPSRARASADDAAQRLPYRPASLTPATDDRPFFNLTRPWSSIGADEISRVLASGARARARLEDLPVAQVAIILLLLESLLIAGVFLIPPWQTLKRSGVAPGMVNRVAVFFASLGFSFIVVEVSLVQRFTRLLGEPGWSLVAVLSVLLLSSGVGSLLLAGRLAISPARAAMLGVVAAVFVAFVPPMIADGAAGWSFASRVGVVIATVAPVGIAMGAPFAAGLARLRDGRLVAWAWALNSLLSVGGSIAALILGSSLGFSGTALVAGASYGVAFAAALPGEWNRQT